jgi:hypothetical protein
MTNAYPRRRFEMEKAADQDGPPGISADDHWEIALSGLPNETERNTKHNEQ